MQDRLLEEIRSRLDIVDLISEYVDLKKSGQNYKGLCPFHSEKTPSFIVSPDKQIYHCFGCGMGGDIFNFIMRYENMSFAEAVKTLARKAGINFWEKDGVNTVEGIKFRLAELNREALKIFQDNLLRSREASSYLEKRGIDSPAIKKFSIGYAVRSWSYLYEQLKDKGYPDSLVLQAGLVAKGEKGLYDVFRGRIIFPIKNVQGDVIAFGGRATDDSMPKYLNSPDTPLFKKGETLYGLDVSKEDIRKKGFAIIVEGYLDVITSHQKGFLNTIAPLGTALTEAHISRLKRFAKRAIVVFDGDEAGISAAKRSIPILYEQGFRASILLLPAGEDPDSFLRKNNPEVYMNMFDTALSPLTFLFNSSKLDKTETVREAIGIISRVKDILFREELLRELSEITGFREMSLRAELKRIMNNRKGRDNGARSEISGSSFADRGGEEILLLSAMIAFPEKIPQVLENVSPDYFRNTIVKGVLEKIISSQSIESAMVFMTEEEKALISRLAIEPGFDLASVDKVIFDCTTLMKGRIIEASLREIQEKIRNAEKAGENDLLRALLMEKQQILMDLTRLRGKERRNDYER